MRFTPGRRLAARFYAEAVRPALNRPHSAALLGPGSDVLGFDTVRSTDHDWGPRVTVLVAEDDREPVAARLAERLPATFDGYPIGRDAAAMLAPTAGRARTGVTIAEPGAWLRGQLGFDARAGVAVVDWLATPTQLLAEVCAGPVFADDLGDLTAARQRLEWYPTDVWRYVLACQWTRVAQEEAFVGRAGEVGDDFGSVLVAARLARDLTRLWLLMARVYPPYAKWLGTALAATPGGAGLGDALTAALRTGDWRLREEHLCRAYTLAAQQHNALGLTSPLDPAPRGYHDRPFQVIDAGRFAEALLDPVTDAAIRDRPRVGAVDQFADSTDVLSNADRSRAAAMALHGG
jgi:hypothetical protein